MLLAAGADASARDNLGLLIAAQYGDWKSVDRLLAAGASSSGFILSQAAARGDKDIVQSLIDSGADVHWAGDLSLIKAATFGQEDTVKVLLAAGANVHATMTLHFALQCSRDISGQ
jgi:ankyrin repeat protein